ncbi:hypothetical protein GPJ56_008255 [Histomonas meleagridis]|uniref:uncharacterized protein n=1 Tax=Histomonas meleagridis TaxID=135588 RepID=UPI003559BB2A|nr:hypothetical protein GPJ56_008255 [Histomonas meleagridis]KAH0797277.1 hypothetical protein GO595_009959 [Histomonas meleagridis]
MDAAYKKNPVDKNRKLPTDDEQTELFEYIVDNLGEYTEMLFSEDLQIIEESLDWFIETFKTIEYMFEDKILIRLMNLLQNYDDPIKQKTINVLKNIIKFESVMQDTLVENGFLDFMFQNYSPELLSLFYLLSSSNGKYRSILIENGYIEHIQSMFETETPPYVLARLCFSLVNKKIEYEQVNGQKIFTLFQQLLNYLSDDQSCFNIIRSFLHLLGSNDNFVLAFLHFDMLKPFIELQTNNEDYLLSLFDMLIFICNFNEESARYLLDNQVIEFVHFFLNDEYQDLLISKAIDLLSDLSFYIPEAIGMIYDAQLTIDIIDIFYNNSNAGLLKSVVHFCIISMALASPMLYWCLYQQGCYTIIVDSVNIIDEIDIRWALRIIRKGFANGKPDIIDKLRLFLSENSEFIEWLEMLRASDDGELREAGESLLNQIYPENPVYVTY